MATLELLPVAKSKAPNREEPAKPFLLKLPPEYRDALQVAEKATGRPMTVTGQMALELFFRITGVPFTPNWPETPLPGERRS